MADNLVVTPGSGATVAADDIGGGVLAQRVKPVFGVDGTGVDVSASNPLPVTSVVTSVPALVAGSAIIGKVGIDQTTPGTTNLVAAGQSGTWNIATLTSLSQFGGNAINLGAGTVGTGTLRITQASDSPEITALGAPADAAWASGNGSAIALLKAIATNAISTAASPVSIDHTTPGTTDAVQISNSPSGNTAKSYAGSFVVAATALTRPANVTAYSIGDSISNNATAASVTANSVSLSDTNDHPIDLAEILLDTTDTGPGTAGAKFTLHLFNSDPTASSGVINGDNGAWSNKKAGWVGSFSGTMTAFNDGSRGVLAPDVGSLRMTVPASGTKTYYWQLQTQTAFTPSANSTTFTPTFKGFQARPA